MRLLSHHHQQVPASALSRAPARICLAANKIMAFSGKQYELVPLSFELEARSGLVICGHEKKPFANRA